MAHPLLPAFPFKQTGKPSTASLPYRSRASFKLLWGISFRGTSPSAGSEASACPEGWSCSAWNGSWGGSSGCSWSPEVFPSHLVPLAALPSSSQEAFWGQFSERFFSPSKVTDPSSCRTVSDQSIGLAGPFELMSSWIRTSSPPWRGRTTVVRLPVSSSMETGQVWTRRGENRASLGKMVNAHQGLGVLVLAKLPSVSTMSFRPRLNLKFCGAQVLLKLLFTWHATRHIIIVTSLERSHQGLSCDRRLVDCCAF